MAKEADKTTVAAGGWDPSSSQPISEESSSRDSSESPLRELSPQGLLQGALNSEVADSEATDSDEEEDWHFDDPNAKRIGRFRIQEPLGKGGFGDVYLAHDESLKRAVALKIINRGAFGESEEALLEEGRTLAQLDHPGIVTVHDVGKDGDRLFFVSAYVEGRTLGQVIRHERPEPVGAAQLIAEVAEALAYAHSQAIIHRDIKPNNIIVTSEGRPVVIDFGIALAASQTTGKARRAILGTPEYMSPEQARGESHLVDGRTDLYSLGVILYEILTGERPFDGNNEDLIEQVASSTLDARPPRQIDARIPKAIERICLKALAKRTADRYPTAQDLADDLKSFVGASEKKKANDTQTVHAGFVIPKGLRSFDEDDSDFFLQLLPGLRDQAGIPDGIRFWQRGIGNTVDPFRVGVLYGPSGSGKSSFLKAGLIPLLSESIEVIYVSADAEKTEEILFERLRDRFPILEGEDSLGESIRRVREQDLLAGDGKLLIVIDQFEQWLHANGKAPDSDLVSALRQCDGKRVQVILTLRDDFWMAIGQLMEDIDVLLLQSQNAAAIDLFEKPHARRVLIEFGRAYERFPGGEGELSAGQEEFINAALADMEENGKIIPLQLALFSETAKNVEWTRESYDAMGGATAIGVDFLNSVFTISSANPAHRGVEKPARAILEALLPTGESRIRGRPLGKEELLEKSGLVAEPGKFDTTVRILDNELKLITPVDSSHAAENDDGERRYQLTHDYLVPSLRDWLFENDRSSVRGRAYLRLSELSGAWRNSRDRRHLPSFGEWLRFRWLVPKNRLDEHDRNFIKAADRKNGRQAAILLGIGAVLTAGWGFFGYHASVERSVDRIVHAGVTEIPAVLNLPLSKRSAVTHQLERLMESGQLKEGQQVNAALALLDDDPGQARYLYEKLVSLPAPAHAVVSEFLTPLGNRFVDEAWQAVENPDSLEFERLRLLAYLAGLDPHSSKWESMASIVTASLTSAPVFEIAGWSRQLRPVNGYLGTHLARESESRNNAPVTSRKLTIVRAEFAEGDLDALLALLDTARVSDLKVVAEKLGEVRGPAVKAIREMMQKRMFPIGSGSERERLAQEGARYAVVLMMLNDFEMVWPQFDFAPDQTCRTRLIHLLAESGIDPEVIYQQANQEPSEAIRMALVQSLGEFGVNEIPSADRRQIVDWLRELSRKSQDSGVRASADWVLSKWKIDPGELSSQSPTTRNWLALSEGEIMSVLDLPGRSRRIRRYAIGAFEVTNEQIHREGLVLKGAEESSMPDWEVYPVTSISMFEAMRFCNRISKREGFLESEWCYQELGEGIENEVVPYPDFTSRRGFRLPTFEEWGFAARGGTATLRYPGSGQSLISNYEWHSGNSLNGEKMSGGRLKPNNFGLFDILGNVEEWCHQGQHAVSAGRSFRYSPIRFSSDAQLKLFFDYSSDALGLRLARTVEVQE